MRIEPVAAGFRVTDEMSFTPRDLVSVALAIQVQTGFDVRGWPLTIEYDDLTLWWTVWFIRPISDEQYERYAREYNDY